MILRNIDTAKGNAMKYVSFWYQVVFLIRMSFHIMHILGKLEDNIICTTKY